MANIVEVEFIKDEDGRDVIYQEGEDSNITLTFSDLDGSVITKANLITLTVTQFEQELQKLINSRNHQTIIDANGGTVGVDGTTLLRLNPNDTIISNARTAVGSYEVHVLYFDWTWHDGVATRTGKGKTLAYKVEHRASPT